jgi:hypothetical protein
MEAGERRFARRLESLLEDDYLCWYNTPIGSKSLHPDFILLHPQRGLLVLEVKDWQLNTIRSMDRHSALLNTSQGLKQTLNPLAQARQYALALKEILETDRALVAPSDHPYAGRLLCPYGFGVVFANIARKEFDSTNLREVIDPDLVICKDEMTESADAAAFQERLWRMLKVTFRHTLTLPQIDRIRWHVFPEIRIEQASLLLGSDTARTEGEEQGEDALLRVMDIQQEQLARSLGEGHRVIHGVAGSGKTLILGYRCSYLADLVTKPILVLCYNVSLAAKLQHAIHARGLSERVSVQSFHRWCTNQLHTYHVALPHEGPDFFESLVRTFIAGVEQGLIPRAQYAAIMIDEGHDFEPEWLQIVCQMLDPQTNSLLLLYDDAQSIYGARRARNFSFSRLGIQARGRTTILRVNYRNTAEVLRFAYEFAKDVLTPEQAEEDGVPLVKPESAGRHGPRPTLTMLSSLKEEAAYLVEQLLGLQREGRRWSDMAVLYSARFIGEEVTCALRSAGIPLEWLQERKDSRHFDPGHDSVKVMTIHSSKGLEFPIVAIPGIGFLPYKDPVADARLLYVGITRAMDRLFVTAHRQSAFALRLSEL